MVFCFSFIILLVLVVPHFAESMKFQKGFFSLPYLISKLGPTRKIFHWNFIEKRQDILGSTFRQDGFSRMKGEWIGISIVQQSGKETNVALTGKDSNATTTIMTMTMTTISMTVAIFILMMVVVEIQGSLFNGSSKF
mmetsp:Transcript_52768/g.148063  ORF Transcript_52768/g.148063 Transcript_52768/m.148063 type:complete len:137 (+) Transcript_52768:102-512(+)